MDWSLILSVAALIVGPLSGVVVAALGARASRGNTAETVAPAEHDATTREFTELRASYAEALRQSNELYDRLEKRFEVLDEKFNKQAEKQERMVQHIVALERLVPNPPGPPARPNWN